MGGFNKFGYIGCSPAWIYWLFVRLTGSVSLDLLVVGLLGYIARMLGWRVQPAWIYWLFVCLDILVVLKAGGFNLLRYIGCLLSWRVQSAWIYWLFVRLAGSISLDILMFVGELVQPAWPAFLGRR